MAIRARTDNLSLEGPDPSLASPEEFSELWAHRDTLLRRCLRLVGNAATAEDLVQETYVRALLSGERLERTRSAMPWLATVARRRSIDELRLREQCAVVSTTPDPPTGSTDDPAQWAVHRDLVDRVRAAMAELGPRERELLLRRAQGASVAEIAVAESTSVASVRSALSRARRKVRRELQDGGVLGVVIFPRFLLSSGARLRRWAAQIEASLPMATGAGVHVGRLVAVVVTAVLSLLGGSVPPLRATFDAATWAPAAHAGVRPTSSRADAHATGHDSPEPGTTGKGKAKAKGAPPPVTPSTLPSVPDVPGIDLPDLPSDYGEQPDYGMIHSFAASGDGRVVLTAADAPTVDPERIYRTDDGGATWKQLAAVGYKGGRLLLPPAFPEDPRVFAVGGSTLQLSEDGGNSFLDTFPAQGEGVLSPDFGAGDERVFVAGPPLSSYRYNDPAPTPMGMLPSSPSEGAIDIGPAWASVQELLVSTTLPDGASDVPAVFSCQSETCTERTRFPGMRRPPHVVSSRHRPGHVMAWYDNLVFRSVDGGITFSPRPIPQGLNLSFVYEGPDGDLYLAGGGIGPRNPVASGLFVSHDAGETWLPVGQGSSVEHGVRRVIALPGGRLLAALLTDPGIVCSVDHGATWAPRCP